MASLDYFAATIMATLGGLHLIYALSDLFIRPRYFSPKDKTLLKAMRETQPAISAQARNYWLSVIGFNISHSIGVLLLALLIVLAHDPHLAWIRPGLVGLALTFALISWKCWFWIPTWGSLATAALLALAWFW